MPKNFTVTISDEGLKAAEAADGGDCYSFQDWIQNTANQMVRRSTDMLIEKNTNLNFKKISQSEKEAIIKDLPLETAKDRHEKLILESAPPYPGRKS